MFRKLASVALALALATAPQTTRAQGLTPHRASGAIGTTVDDETNVIGSTLLREGVSIADVVTYRLSLFWLFPLFAQQQQEFAGRDASGLALAGLSTRNAPRTAFMPEIVAGITGRRADVTSFTSSTGVVFPTTGDRDFFGGYLGLNGRLMGLDPQDRLAWNIFGHVGYGRAEVNGFGGTFQRAENGVFYEVGTGVDFRLSDRVSAGPQISYFHFDNGTIEMKDWTAEITLSIDLN